MATSRSRRATPTARKAKPRPRQSPRRQPVDPSSHSLPGTALHELALLTGEASRGLGRARNEDDPLIHLRNPLEVAKELKQRLVSLGPAVQKRVAAKIAPQLAAPRLLPLDLVSLLVGVVLVATQRYWALLFAGYGAIALVHNSLTRRRFDRAFLAAVDAAIEPDLRVLSSDRARAKGLAARYGENGDLGFLDGGDPPAAVQLPQGERVLLSASGVLRAREGKGGLQRAGEGKLLLTNARLLFIASEGVSELELDRVVRADVVDELRLVLIPSKREAPAIYFAMGHAHTFAQAIRLARGELIGGQEWA